MSDRTDAGNVGIANLRFARALVESLQSAGVAAAFVCPGSRSTPLALAISERPGLLHGVHVDERSASFHALGYAKATGRPALLLCTSGTAGAHFLPAVAEACHSRVPLIVLTADRPPELRAWGAAQTMEQRTLYAGFTRWSEEAPCPGERGNELPYAGSLARRAVGEATGPVPGPVHLNLPFREPLLPAQIESVEIGPRAVVSPIPAWTAAPIDGADLAGEIGRAARGVLVLGPDQWDPSLRAAVAGFVDALGWPVIADPASGLRAGDMPGGAVIHGADLLLRNAAASSSLRPDLVVRFGGPPTSRAINEWLARHASADLWLVDPAGGYRDPQHRANRSCRAVPSQFCAIASSLTGTPGAEARSWRSQWDRADRAARAAAAAAIAAEPRFLTPHLSAALWAQLPAGATLCAGNSMAIRDLDAFAGPRGAPLRVLANRGVNGIDGLVSSALGAAAALGAPTVLWCGDLALLHDVAGLLAGRMQDANLTIVVSNDDGGGIFEYLPAAKSLPRPVFERMFAVPHGLDLSDLARGLGWEAARVASAPSFAAALARALEGGRHVIEVPVDRAVNTAFHRSLDAAVGAALDREFAG